MMKKIYFNISMVLLVILMTSCTDESTFKNPATHHLDKGAFARFQESNAPSVVAFDDPTNAQFTRTVFDANNNMASYKLDFVANLVDGRVLAGKDFYFTESFPAALNISAQSLADNLGLSLSDFNFGDNFEFTATAVRNDGTEFTVSEEIGLEFNGNTEPNLFLPSYTNAMSFSFTFACPTFENKALEGTWNVETLGFSGFFGETQTTRQIIAGPAANQITIVGGEYPTAGGENNDLIITFDEAGIATAVNEDGVAFGPGNSQGLATNTYLLEDGLLLPCADRINLTLNFSPFSGNPHPFVLTR